MLHFYRIATILIFVFPLSIYAEESPRPFEALKAQVIQCLADPTLSSGTCNVVKETLKKHEAVQEDGYIFSKEEMKIRRELKALGLDLPRKIIPLTYKHVKRKSGDFVIVFDWSSGYEWNTYRGREDIDYIIFLGKIFPDPSYWDGGYFGHIHIFTRTKPVESFSPSGLHKVNAELMDEDSEEFNMRTSYWFSSGLQRNCISAPGQPKKQIACLSYFYSQEWPEIHVWQDWRASTGIQMSSFAFDGNIYNHLMDAHGRYVLERKLPKGSTSRVAFHKSTSREGYSDTWSYAHPGHVSIWNNKSKKLIVSDELTKEYFPVIKRKLKGDPSEPSSAGIFSDSNGTIYEFIQ